MCFMYLLAAGGFGALGNHALFTPRHDEDRTGVDEGLMWRVV